MDNKKNYRRRKRPVPVTPYIIGTVFLLVAVILSIMGLKNNNPEPTPTPAVSPSSQPTAAPTEVLPSESPTTPEPTPEQTETPILTSQPTAVGTDYEIINMTQDDIYQGKLILINGSNPYRFIDFENFVCLYDYKSDAYKVGDYSIYFAEDAVAPLNSMLNDFYYYTGVNAVLAASGHRTYDYQEMLFEKEVEEKGEAEAALWVARPGTSEHHSGLAIDFAILYDDGGYYSYDGTGDFAWINENCHKYGFIVRYNSDKKDITKINYEPWHFRYLGIPHATEVARLGLCYEEYMDYLRDYTYDNPLQIVTDDGVTYETYFCSGLSVRVPESGDYEISGNNVDGFIVTVKVS